MSSKLQERITLHYLLHTKTKGKKKSEEENYLSINAVDFRHKDVLTPESLSKLWNIGLKIAKSTILATTYKCIPSTGLLKKKFKTDESKLRYKQLSRFFGTFYVNFLKSSVQSIRGHIGGVLHYNKLGFKKFFPCSNEDKEEPNHSLNSFIEIIGLPATLYLDNRKNFKDGLFKSTPRQFGRLSSFTEPKSPWQNRAEIAIGEVQRYARQLTQRSSTPIRLWCFCFEYTANIISLCATGRFDLKGRTPCEVVTNYIPDILKKVGKIKFGVMVPSSVQEALWLDREIGNTRKQDTISTSQTNSI